MLERIVENWLINARELDYQTAFAQLLSAEGYRVLHAPVHHPFEHGKDVVGLTPEGHIHAFQLKGGDIGLGEFEKLQGQLFALAGTAITYPGIEPPQSPDRVFLVTNGRLTPPARDRIRSFNDANRTRQFPPIELIEVDQLVARMVAAHGKYLPQDLSDLNALLRFVLAEGTGPFPVRDFTGVLWNALSATATRSNADVGRLLAAMTILTSYVMGPWQRRENHLGAAEAWLVLAFAILLIAELQDLEEDAWLLSFELARDSARISLGALVEEASNADDLVIPDITDGTVYFGRATVVCGYAAAFLLSERAIDASPHAEMVQRLLLREIEYAKAPGEAGVPFLLLAALAFEVLGMPHRPQN